MPLYPVQSPRGRTTTDAGVTLKNQGGIALAVPLEFALSVTYLASEYPTWTAYYKTIPRPPAGDNGVHERSRDPGLLPAPRPGG